ncbi:MAG: hypothetical protein A2V86_00555 [Deltaproteobacteria bacterium RBG_16_49_23]|nr:MAG: hypothetical protein A2V86_00555 [Deltaproteobacteria bacterium RBG_16_49_23]
MAVAGLVRKKQAKLIELVDAANERIERFNPSFNAVVTPMYEQARTPAIGKIPEGPFVGVHFIGRFGDEAALFRLAAQLESARPWVSRKPPVSG